MFSIFPIFSMYGSCTSGHTDCLAIFKSAAYYALTDEELREILARNYIQVVEAARRHTSKFGLEPQCTFGSLKCRKKPDLKCGRPGDGVARSHPT